MHLVCVCASIVKCAVVIGLSFLSKGLSKSTLCQPKMLVYFATIDAVVV